ncbi:MAG: sugar phosphate isomerase/epimerase [Oscillospiraceae bacterium]|nr:sugar phosphate isomerase/epimerase [Oscillospiraceae bacterium]
MKLCLSSQSLDRKFFSKEMHLFSFIQYAYKQGFRVIELEDKHLESTEKAYLDKVRNYMGKYGITCANIAFDNSFGYPSTEKNFAEVERARTWMDVALELGTPNFRLFAGWMGGLDPGLGTKGPTVQKQASAWDEMVLCMQKGCAIAKEKGLHVVIENHNHGGFLSSSFDVINLFAQLDKNVASLLLDTGNYIDNMEGIERTVDMATRHIHLKLNTIVGDGSDSVYDLPAIIDLIIKAGFTGSLSLEYEGVQEEYDVLPKVTRFVNDLINNRT